MPDLVPIAALDDPRLAPYRNLKDRDIARLGGRFIAESANVVRRLIASPYPVESILVARERLAHVADALPAEGVPVFVVDHALVHQVVGYKFHSGVMAVGLRPPPVPLAALAEHWPARATLMVLPETTNTDNLGALIRIAAGFGATALLLGPRCCDPFYRQAIRVSMGTVFHVPLILSDDLHRDLRALREEWDFELAATVLDPAAEPLAGSARGPRLGLLLGNEAQGLARTDVLACDRRVTIPMQLGTDSLNVAVAAGIVMYHFCQQV